MNYEEFKEWDIFNAYKEYVPVSFAKEIGYIADDIQEFIPDKCKCGSDNIIKPSLQSMMCCNPYCEIKMAESMAEMFSRFGIKQLGVKTCMTFVKYGLSSGLFKIPSHVEILNIDQSVLNIATFGAKGYLLVDAINTIKTTPLTFSDLIKKMALPYFDSKCDEIFKGINSIKDLMGYLKSGKDFKKFFYDRGVYSDAVLESFMKNLNAIISFEASYNRPCLPTSVRQRHICITGRISLNGYTITKADFIRECNLLLNYNGVQLVTIVLNKAIVSTQYLIADYVSSSSQYCTAKSRERMEGRKIIMTAQEYYNMLKEEMNQCLKMEN